MESEMDTSADISQETFLMSTHLGVVFMRPSNRVQHSMWEESQKARTTSWAKRWGALRQISQNWILPVTEGNITSRVSKQKEKTEKKKKMGKGEGDDNHNDS